MGARRRVRYFFGLGEGLVRGDTERVIAVADAIRGELLGWRGEQSSLNRGSKGVGWALLRRRGPFEALLHTWADESGSGMDVAAEILEKALDRVQTSDAVALYSGWAGLGWLCAQLGAEDEFVCEHADRLLHRALVDRSVHHSYDLISGLVGMGVYFLERLPRDAGVRGLASVLDALEQGATETGAGTTWFTPAESLPAWQREKAPNGYYNLGVAHGVPGVLWLLAKLASGGIETERARDLLRSGLAWMCAQQVDPDRAELPSWIAPGVPREDGRRMAWCYGPLGASAVVWDAARAIGDDRAEDWARRMARACAEVPPERGLVRDAGLCHGAAGNAHIFHRLYRRTGDARFRNAARAWIAATLAFERAGEGVGGFRMWGDLGENQQGWVDDASFLSGSAGVALALLSAVTDTDPEWDRLLLLS